MYPSAVIQPLSPPSSPGMSGQDPKLAASNWAKPGTQQTDYMGTGQPTQGADSLGFPTTTFGPRDGTQQPQQEFYGRLGNPSPTPTISQAQSAGGSEADFVQKQSDPVQRPGVQRQESEADILDGDDDLISDESEDKEDGQEKRPMTAAEIRQQKRKMKRFRLTHSQTRYLMSEFARFPHPDAARREKLSREIPGLSPRQVQVWFQNRRAKLKRLSVEDRERMMRSRVLPESYGMGMAVNSPTFMSPGSNGAVHDHRMARLGSLTLDTMQRRMDHNLTSPMTYTAGMSAITFTPPQSATDTRSPTSTPGDFAFGGRPGMNSPRRMSVPTLHAGSLNYPNGLNSIGGRMSSYERLRTSGGDAATDPLRSSSSYPALRTQTPTTTTEESREDGTQSAMHSVSHSRVGSQRDMPPPNVPFGLGFSFDSMPNYQSTVHGATNPTSPVKDNVFRGGMSVPANMAGAQSSYFEYSPPAYSTPQPPQYMSTFNGSYSSPLASHPFGHTPNNLHTMMSPMHGEHTFAPRDTGRQLHRQDSAHSSDGGVALGSY